MIAAKPVVATNGGGVPEIVQDGISGLLVPMSDDEAMADAILSLLRDPERATRIAEAGRKRVQEHFLIEHTTRKVETIYDEITGTYRCQSLLLRVMLSCFDALCER
jgi:glycosyltransferase involved in cell wall biosynthesis